MAMNAVRESTTIPRLLRIPQVAEAAEMSPRKIHALVASGELPSVRIGRSVRVDVRDFDRWLDSLKTAR